MALSRPESRNFGIEREILNPKFPETFEPETLIDSGFGVWDPVKFRVYAA